MAQIFNPDAEFVVLAAQELVARFTTVDYAVFFTMIAISGLIGLYGAFNGGPQNTIRQMLTADGQLPAPLVSTSLMASFICASYMLGEFYSLIVEVSLLEKNIFFRGTPKTRSISMVETEM